MRIVFLSHTHLDGTFVVGSHQLANELSRAGHRVAHVSTPLTPMHILLLRDVDVRRRFRQFLRPSISSAGVLSTVPMAILPWQAASRIAPLWRNYGRFSYPRIRSMLERHMSGPIDLVFIDQPRLVGLTKALNPRAILYRPTDLYFQMPGGSTVASAEALAIARSTTAIGGIPDERYMPVHYPGAVVDPDTGELISDAQVAEVGYTAFAGTRYEITGRLVVRRVLDADTQDPLFPVWRYHPVFTNNTEPVDQADITHRRHAVCETVWSDLIDGPWAHQPSGSFAANAAWCILAAICHNLLRAAGTLTGAARYAVARGATLRTRLINIPARLARPQRRPFLHLPAHWPRADSWLTFWKAVFT